MTWSCVCVYVCVVCCVYGVVLLVGVVGSVQVPGMIVLSYLSLARYRYRDK